MTQPALVQVDDLTIVAKPRHGPEKVIVDQVSFQIQPGEVLALIGESGSGKTTIALALLAHTRRGCRIKQGSVRVGDTSMTEAHPARIRSLRGNKVAYVAQSAAAAFNPSIRIMDQVIEPAIIHHTLSERQARERAIALFGELALPSPETIGQRYPHQVSGGQLQRLMAAMALINDPDVIVFDEPTTALDVTTQIDVLRAFKKVLQRRRTCAVYVSHDLSVVAQMADRVVVLHDGAIQETATIDQVLSQPAHAYTRELLAAADPATRAQHRPTPHDGSPARPPLLTVRNLNVGYGPKNREGKPRIHVLHDINLELQRGMTLGVIGESGSGKSSLAWTLAGLVVPFTGTMDFAGKPLDPHYVRRAREHDRRIQLVFQNADTVLNPSHTIADILSRPLYVFHGMQGQARQARIRQLLDMVKLPASVAGRQPGDLSGGQKQRVNLARALAAQPELLLCDEVTSALDTVVGAAILDLLTELQTELGITCLFISHDISVIRAICDDVMVLYQGRQVDRCAISELDSPERHAYTRELLASVPELRRGWLEETPH